MGNLKTPAGELPKILGITVHSIFHITIEYHYQGRHGVIDLEYDDAADLADAITETPDNYERNAQLAVLCEEAHA